MRCGGADLHDRFDFHRDVLGQPTHPDRRPRVPSGVAEDLHEQIGTAVDHLWMFAKSLHRVDHAEELHHAYDAIEIAERGLRGGEKLQPDQPRVLVRVLLGDIGPDNAAMEFAAANAWTLAREEQQIAKEMTELSAKAREGKLGPADMQGGCFSISSLGGIGGTAFTPIINAPEVAILGVSKSLQKPVWDGKQFAPRLMVPLSLSYDHRVIDGAAAARFTAYLAQLLVDMRRSLL